MVAMFVSRSGWN